MRFNTPVYFRTVKPGAYDATTGNHGESTVTEVKRYASVTDAGDEVLKRIYGELIKGCLVVRLQNPYTAPFDQIRIGDKNYCPDRTRRLITKHTFVVREVP